MNLEEIKSKLSKKKSLATCFNIGGAAAAAAAGVAAGLGSNQAITAARVAEKANLLQSYYVSYIEGMERVWIKPYGLEFEKDGFTYLQNLQAHKEVWGKDFDYMYNLYETTFSTVYNGIIKPDEILTQSIAIGVGAAVLAWALVAALPTANYLKCRKKYKELVKQNGELKEEQENVL